MDNDDFGAAKINFSFECSNLRRQTETKVFAYLPVCHPETMLMLPAKLV